MKSPMDNFQAMQANYTQPDLAQALRQAKQNPKAFEEQFRRTNPQAYNAALQIRNQFANPQQAVIQLAQQKGINPNIIRMLDL